MIRATGCENSVAFFVMRKRLLFLKFTLRSAHSLCYNVYYVSNNVVYIIHNGREDK